MDLINLNSFLKFGYFLKYQSSIKLDFSGLNKSRYSGLTENEIIETGSNLFKKIISEYFVPGKKHVVPLSGGLDSRGLLAALLEFTSAENISTYTFGTPGAYDFEIGNTIAKNTGTKHFAMPLNEHEYSLNEEIALSQRTDSQTFLFHHPPLNILDNHFSGHVIWSGYIGDWIAGSYLRTNPADNILDAKKGIIEKETFSRNIRLTNVSDDEFNNLFELHNSINPDLLSYEEQIEAQNKLIKNTVPNILFGGFNYITPYINAEWINFLMNLDNKFRHDEYIFKKILYRLSPRLFSMPTKTNLGLPLNSSANRLLIRRIIRKAKNIFNSRIFTLFPDKGINYIYFADAIRNRSDINKLIHSSVMDLSERNIVDWIDIKSIWNKHISKNKNYSEALILLASLEIHLKAGKVV
ncbi:MAG: asparagine synthase-related protein [Ignavibacteria bacterium]|nr:asparagine synthase-related protein [Ignavibacteria bacterium]